MFHALLAKLFKTRDEAARRFQEMHRRSAGQGQGSGAKEKEPDDSDSPEAAVRMDGGVGTGAAGRKSAAAAPGTDPDDDMPMAKPFLDHLEDFRKLVFRLAITLLVALMLCFVFNAYLLELIQMPLKWANVEVPVLNEAGEQVDTRRARVDELVEVRSIRVTGTFMLTIRLAFICGAILTFPVLLFMVLNFIIPGLGRKARRLVLMIIGASMTLLVFGLVFGFVGVLPRIMEYFFLFGSDRGIEVKWTIENYVKFSSRILIVFAISFQLPLLVMSLVKLDILSFSIMHRTRNFAIIGIAVLSALLTPPDALTMALMGIPMVLLYEICIWLAWLIERRDRRLHPEYYEDDDRGAQQEADALAQPTSESEPPFDVNEDEKKP